MKQYPLEGRQRETKENKPGNYDETISSGRIQRKINLKITTKHDPVKGQKQNLHDITSFKGHQEGRYAWKTGCGNHSEIIMETSFGNKSDPAGKSSRGGNCKGFGDQQSNL